MIHWVLRQVLARAETRIGVRLDYARQIARTDLGLMLRCGKIFGFLDPNRKVPAAAYHVARLRGAISADWGTCLEAEINLAKAAGLSPEVIGAVLRADLAALGEDLAAVARLADAVVRDRVDAPEDRERVRRAFGEAGLIELSYAMTGAALLPGVKRAMGYATVCSLDTLRKLA